MKKMEITACNVLQDPSHAILNFISRLSLPHSQVYVEFFALLTQPSQLLWAFFPVLFFHVCYLLPQIEHSLEDEDWVERKIELQSVDRVGSQQNIFAAAAAAMLLQPTVSYRVHFPAKPELLLKVAFPATQSSQPKRKSKQEQTQCGLWQRSPSLHI